MFQLAHKTPEAHLVNCGGGARAFIKSVHFCRAYHVCHFEYLLFDRRRIGCSLADDKSARDALLRRSFILSGSTRLGRHPLICVSVAVTCRKSNE